MPESDGWDERSIFAPDVAFEWTVPEQSPAEASQDSATAQAEPRCL